MDTAPNRIRIGFAIVALVLLWQAGAGVWLMGELLVRDLRTEGMFDTEEGRLRRAFAEHWETYSELRQRVPEDGVIYCNLVHPLGHEKALASGFLLQRLRHSLHPRVVRGFDFRNPVHRATLPADPPANFFICDLGARDDAMLTARPLGNSPRKSPFASWPSKMAAAMDAATADDD